MNGIQSISIFYKRYFIILSLFKNIAFLLNYQI